MGKSKWDTGKLETEVGEGAVCLSHFMDVIALADGGALVIGGVFDLVSEGDVHGGAFTVPSVGDEPAHGEGLGAIWIHFERHLVGGTTDAAGLDLNAWLGVFHGTGDDFERIDGIGSFVGAINGGVDDALGERALAVLHDFGDKMADDWAVVTWVATVGLGEDSLAAWHDWGSLRVGKKGLLGGLWSLCAVFGTSLAALVDSEGIE